METESEYIAHVLPHEDHDLLRYADKYSSLKLKALQQNPEAFSSTYAAELAMTEKAKMERLKRSSQQITIVSKRAKGGNSHWLEEEWVGQVTLVGPKNKEEYFDPYDIYGADAQQKPQRYTFSRDYTETQSGDMEAEANCYFHMTALYVDSHHRRKGIANILCEKSFEVAANASRSFQGGHVSNGMADIRIVIAPTNLVVVSMYEKLGFRMAVEKATLAEAIVASGDMASLVENYQSIKKYNERIGLVMIKRAHSSDHQAENIDQYVI